MESFRKEYESKKELFNKTARELNQLEEKRIDYCKNKVIDVIENHPILDDKFAKNAGYYYFDDIGYDGMQQQSLIIAIDNYDEYYSGNAICFDDIIEDINEVLHKELLLPYNESVVFVEIVDKNNCEFETRHAVKLL